MYNWDRNILPCAAAAHGSLARVDLGRPSPGAADAPGMRFRV